MTLHGARTISDPDELIFSEEYKKFARSSFETNALANDLLAWYDRKHKLKYADRDNFRLLSSVFEREKRDHEESETHSAEVASLKDEVARIGKREAELTGEVAKLGDREISLMGEVAKLEADVAFSRDHDERELTRLRNDRFAKVSRITQKAQARLGKVKSYIKEQEHIVQPKMDALNPSKGAQEIVAVLVSRGAVVSESELENLAKEARITEEEVDALNAIELSTCLLISSVSGLLGYLLSQVSLQTEILFRVRPMFYLGPSASKAESTKSQNYVNLIGLKHQDQCRELQYFRIKKRKVDDRLEELEAEVARLRAKRRRVIVRLDEIEQTTRALEIGSEDWEKVGLQLIWPMPDRLLRDNRPVRNRAI
ncbi:unnamed protein product [Arabidopsis arenosa]|uniref:Uncharacterized protein n=1 Tax=Arabidopsis arenosa TaxID=38785 RepID=A0A8S2B358_ARAAE|nr:unnamed protein product [Arabidopsis arenosa]